jgi:hypothetical protein
VGGGDAAKFDRGKWNGGLPTIPTGHVTIPLVQKQCITQSSPVCLSPHDSTTVCPLHCGDCSVTLTFTRLLRFASCVLRPAFCVLRYEYLRQ